MGEKSVDNKKIRFVALSACALAVVLFLIFFSRNIASDFSEHIQHQRRSSISKMVHLSYNTIKPVIDRVKAGEIEREQARKQIRDIVREMTYEDEFGLNYIFMSTYEGIMLVQPFEPQKEGTDQWYLMDAKGNLIIRELVKAAQEKPYGSFVTYYYYPPGKSEPEEKLSYVIGIPEIGAYIGTGMYIESTYHELGKILEYQKYGYIALTLFIIAVIMFYFREINKANKMLIKEISFRRKAEEDLKNRYLELHNTKKELEEKHDELSEIYEELIATEEELRTQYEELQKSQSETREFTERYMLASEGSKDVIWDWDIKDDKVYISERLREILGYSRNELKIERHEELYDIMHPEDTEKEYLSYHRYINSGTEYYSSEFRLRCKDGSYKWFQSRVKSVLGANGDVIRNAGSLTDITERKEHEAETRKLAYFDSLTDLPNRVFAVNQLNDKLSQYPIDSCSGSIFFVDIDNFKIINDTFGHSYGDKVLIEVSNRLKSLSPDELTIARIGGDEFIVIQDVYKDEEDVKGLAQRVLESFKDPVNIERNNFHIACSIGIALYPMHGSTTEEILKNADLAMYKAKNMGKNRYVLYDHSMSSDMSERIETEKSIRLAFENEEFELYYQPCTGAKERNLIGFEALIRWNSPVYGLVGPDNFISIAEEIGLINKIGNWVIEKSFAFARTLKDKNLCVSCNVSPRQLMQSNFVEDVIEAFDRHGLKRGCVAIEITESSLVESFEETIEKLKRLRDKGILLYLDDFGTGYSSLNYLKELPIDIMKIDKSFIDGIISGGVEARIVRSIISLAHKIGLKVVAEGVETVEQLQYLAKSRCDYIQGYVICKPVPGPKAIEFI